MKGFPSFLKNYDAVMSVKERKVLFEKASTLPVDATMLEIGSFRGGSALALCAGAPDGSILHCVDTWNDMYDEKTDTWTHDETQDRTYNTFLSNVSDYEDCIIPHRETSSEIAKSGILEKSTVDLFLLDAEHTYAGTKKHLHIWLPYLKDKSLIMVHDVGLRDGCRRAVEEIVEPRSVWSKIYHDNLFVGLLSLER